MRANYKKLIKIVESFGNAKVLVAGDLVLDRFWFGSVQRISREAPVPIVKLIKSSTAPGCGANCASNLASLGAKPLVLGVVGRDEEGKSLVELLRRLGCVTKYILMERDFSTPTKTRILAGSLHGPKQQLVRVDSGEEPDFKANLLKKIEQELRRAVADACSAIVSDYGYGLFENTKIFEIIRKVKIVGVDSRFSLLNFKGATTATPNEEEFEKAIKKPVPETRNEFEKEGEKLRSALGLDALLVTRGSKGMALFEKSKKAVHIDIVGKDEVVDVTGAGDTVIATYILSLSQGADFAEAANIANIAGGIVVQKPGTATVTQEELISHIDKWGKKLI
ncbi:MAG: bifunctional ADP-heptose synthase [Acidobacteria bacterium]|nr:bifunctional ADP-heptose synthase [Acidobacteriota bacterium]